MNKSTVSKCVRGSVEDSIRVPVWWSVWDSVRNSVEDSIRVPVRNSVWYSIRVPVWDSAKDYFQTNSNIIKQ